MLHQRQRPVPPLSVLVRSSLRSVSSLCNVFDLPHIAQENEAVSSPHPFLPSLRCVDNDDLEYEVTRTGKSAGQVNQNR